MFSVGAVVAYAVKRQRDGKEGRKALALSSKAARLRVTSKSASSNPLSSKRLGKQGKGKSAAGEKGGFTENPLLTSRAAKASALASALKEQQQQQHQQQKAKKEEEEEEEEEEEKPEVEEEEVEEERAEETTDESGEEEEEGEQSLAEAADDTGNPPPEGPSQTLAPPKKVKLGAKEWSSLRRAVERNPELRPLLTDEATGKLSLPQGIEKLDNGHYKRASDGQVFDSLPGLLDSLQ